MLSSFEVQDQVEVLEKPNLDIHIVGIDAENSTIRDGVLKPWVQCAMHFECIAPSGATKGTHQYAQSALSVLVHKVGVQGLPTKKNDIHIDTQH